LISGTPTTVGTYAVTAIVLDGTQSASQTFTWTIAAAAVNRAPALASVSNKTTRVGQTTTLQLVGSDADGDTLTYTASGLPAGLTINAATGLISGSPTTPGIYRVTVTVSDGRVSATRSFTWTIKKR
jgi:hypothetical protein